MEHYHGFDTHVLLWVHLLDVMMTLLGMNNHRLPLIGVITHTIMQSTSSIMKENMIMLRFLWNIIMDLMHMYYFRYLIRMY
jgi:hypothetical protein